MLLQRNEPINQQMKQEYDAIWTNYNISVILWYNQYL